MSGNFDPDRVAQVMGNLVNNALRYGDPDTPIDVSLRRTGAGIVLEVHNQGQPIPPELLPHVFEAFQRGGGVVQAKRVGHGSAHHAVGCE